MILTPVYGFILTIFSLTDIDRQNFLVRFLSHRVGLIFFVISKSDKKYEIEDNNFGVILNSILKIERLLRFFWDDIHKKWSNVNFKNLSKNF